MMLVHQHQQLLKPSLCPVPYGEIDPATEQVATVGGATVGLPRAGAPIKVKAAIEAKGGKAGVSPPVSEPEAIEEASESGREAPTAVVSVIEAQAKTRAGAEAT
jgi:hypothetical protein